MGGRAVHARGGQRSTYQPLISRLVDPPQAAADPRKIIQAYRHYVGEGPIYLADLDSIMNGPEGLHDRLASLEIESAPLWIDAGLRTVSDLDRLGPGSLRPERWVLGSESVLNLDQLKGLVDRLGSEQTLWSLDLNSWGVRLADPSAWPSTGDLRSILDCVIAVGIRQILLLDLGSVGSAKGWRDPRACELLEKLPHRDLVRWAVGGGVENHEDLLHLGRWGIQDVLIGTALHEGGWRS